MNWFFEHNGERYLVQHDITDDSRIIAKANAHRVLVKFDPSLHVGVFDDKTNGPIAVGYIKSNVSDKWEYCNSSGEVELVLEPVQDWYWKALLNSEIAVAKHLIEKYKLFELTDPVLAGEDEGGQQYQNHWLSDPD